MRIGLLGAFLVFLISGTVAYSPLVAGDIHPADDQQSLSTEESIHKTTDRSSADSFIVESASWNEDDRTLLVRAKMAHEKGTLLTLTGLPESTMLDTFRISAEHSVEYRLPLASNEAPPCQVLVESAFAAETIEVANAPSACQNLLQVSGTVAISPTKRRCMCNIWATAITIRTSGPTSMTGPAPCGRPKPPTRAWNITKKICAAALAPMPTGISIWRHPNR